MRAAARAVAAIWQANGYLPQIGEIARSHCAPFWWHDQFARGAESVKANGTMTFVDTGTAKLGITAFHVLEVWRTVKRDRSLVCQVGGITFDEAIVSVVATDPDADLAVVEISDVFINGTGATWHSATVWPPEPEVAQGDIVVIAGFPGGLRFYGDTQTSFLTPWFITRVHQATPAHLAFSLDLANAHAPGGIGLRGGTDLGGISGGPVFRVHEKPLVRLELVGVCIEGNPGFDLVCARRASAVAANGAILAPSDGWPPRAGVTLA